MNAAIADAVRGSRIRTLMFASSAAVYGTGFDGPLREDSTLRGTSDYALSKIRGEETFRELADDLTGRSVTVLRIFNVAGPDFADSLVQRLLRATSERPVPVVEPDRFVRDYIHQDNVIAVLQAVIDAPALGFRVLNVATGVPVPTRLLLRRLGVDDQRIRLLHGRPGTSWADVSRLAEAVGWTPCAVPDSRWGDAVLPRSIRDE